MHKKNAGAWPTHAGLSAPNPWWCVMSARDRSLLLSLSMASDCVTAESSIACRDSYKQLGGERVMRLIVKM